MSVDRWIAALVCSVVVASAFQARAQRVALVRPNGDDPVLVDAFNRLRAELRIHKFETTELEPTEQAQDPDALAAAAQKADAIASIAFLRHEDKTAVEVWLADRVSGKVTMRSLELTRTSDASSVLAIRAVDLLRASFREFDADRRPPPDVIGVDRGPIPEAAQTLAAPPAPAWMLRAEGLMLSDGSELGFAFGPSLGVSRRIGDRFDLGITVAGPLLGAAYATKDGNATLRQQLAWAELRVHLLRKRLVAVGLNLALGEHYLNAQGQPNAPVLPRSDYVWSVASALGAHAQLNIIGSAALVVSVRALLLTPRAGVGIRARTSLIGQPSLYAAAGIMLGF
jgi:hypothetical protein